jgi:hypothetical protein
MQVWRASDLQLLLPMVSGNHGWRSHLANALGLTPAVSMLSGYCFLFWHVRRLSQGHQLRSLAGLERYGDSQKLQSISLLHVSTAF